MQKLELCYKSYLTKKKKDRMPRFGVILAMQMLQAKAKPNWVHAQISVGTETAVIAEVMKLCNIC